MVTFLEFSSFGSLITYLNVILVAIVVFYAINKFYYIIDVVIYAIAKTFIPIITSLLLGSILGTSVALNIGTIFILIIINFILGLLVIKITEKIISYFDSDTIIYFIIVFSIIDLIVVLLFSFLIRLFI